MDRRPARKVTSLCLGAAVALSVAIPAAAQQVDVSSGSVVQTVETMRPGQYVWVPDVAPQGPMLMIVNIKTQRAVLYRNGVPIGATTISTGRAGHDTPTGIFTVLQKQIVHHSSKYDNAPMPFMERLTWSGVALHAGNLPGYPASHGCIRMPAGFAKLLYGVTALGMTVVIAVMPSAPLVAPQPDLVSAGAPDGSDRRPFSWMPERSPSGPVSIVVSAADHRAVVLRNGIVIGSAAVDVSGPVSGTWAYALRNMDATGQHWVRLELTPGSSPEAVTSGEWQRFSAPPAFRTAVASIVRAGMTIVVTADSLGSAAAPAIVLESGK